MKKFILYIVLVDLFIANSFSQNIGIGTSSPIFKLDVKGSINADSLYRIGGSSVLSINGFQNTFVGVTSGNAITTGILNTGIGFQTLYSVTTGWGNTGMGPQSLFSNTTGNYNTGLGMGALFNNSVGNNNTATGARALTTNSSGIGNTAFGYNTLENNSTGNFNTATGSGVLNGNTTGSYNSANGVDALKSNTTGGYNTAIGSYTLQSNTTTSFNTAIGGVALRDNANSYNTSVGAISLNATVNSQFNTAIGFQAGSSYNHGNNNIFVGANANASVAGLSNLIAVGWGTVVTSSNTARFGNSATVSYGGWAGWSNVSDGRFKKDIEENVPGLDFINKLRPVTYHLDATELDAFLHKNDTSAMSVSVKQLHSIALSEKEKIRYTGFIAQEVEAVAKALGFDFSGVDPAKNENDTYGLRYAEFVVPLVKAVQEQQQMIERLQKRNEELEKLNTAQKKLNDELFRRVEKLELLIADKK